MMQSHTGCIFSVTRRYRSDESYWVSHSLGVSIDFTDLTLVSDDTCRRLYWCDPDYTVMKVNWWLKLISDES